MNQARKVPESLIDYIRDEIGRVGYGRVIVELNDTSDKMDVITEHRHRFYKDPAKKD